MLQGLVDSAVSGRRYFSDGFGTYAGLCHGDGSYSVSEGKRDVYSVEGVNSDIRHYLGRLGRRSRCFSRSVEALRDGFSLFVYAYNRRQLHKRAHPRYPAHLKDFIPP